MTGYSETSGQQREREISFEPRISRLGVLSLCVQRQAAAVRMFLRFFRLWILLRDQQDFPGGTLFRCCVRLVRVLQCETLAKRDRQLT